MATLYRASPDGINFVEQVGVKLRNVVPEFQTRVLGSIHSDAMPEAAKARVWLRTFLEVFGRFNGRKPDGTPEPKGRDYRASEAEWRDIASLAQWLITLHEITEERKTGLPRANKQLTVDINTLIVRERIIA